jgi:HSP20 family molecular chaperone IbpA
MSNKTLSIVDIINPMIRSYMNNELRNIIDNPSDVFSSGMHWHESTNTAYFELPGVDKSDIVTNMSDDGVLTVTADSKDPVMKRKFSYVVKMDPYIVNIDTSKAVYENGLLKISFEKAKPASKRTINIA